MRLRVFVALVLVVVFGCSSQPYQVAQVSGRVTLDGKPLPKASVTFVPMASKDNQAPGPTAAGLTDADGRFKVEVDSRDPRKAGAVVGKCRIYITTVIGDAPADDRDAGGPVKRIRDKVPERYNMKTELVFDVPAGGTDQANFDLKSH
jgi:hypothetical protein